VKRRENLRGHLFLGWRMEARYLVADARRATARRWQRLARAVYEWLWP
jgi:hypothetical protein